MDEWAGEGLFGGEGGGGGVMGVGAGGGGLGVSAAHALVGGYG